MSMIILWLIVDYFVALFLSTYIADTEIAFVVRLGLSMMVGLALFVFGMGTWASVTPQDDEHAN